MASKIHQLLKKSGGLIKSTNISCLLNKHQYRPVASSPLTHYYRSENQQGFGFLNFCTVSSKIHLLKKSAIEAGTPVNYYLNPSDNLMKVESEWWNVVEHKDFLSLTVHVDQFGGAVSIPKDGKFIRFQVRNRDKEHAARFQHKDGMTNFSFEMNLNFLQLGVKDDRTLRLCDGTLRLFLFKLTPEEIKDYAARMRVSKLTPEEIKNSAGARMNDSKPKVDDKKSKYYTLEISVSTRKK